MPISEYNGQKLIKPVIINIPETTSKMIARVPEITLVKKSVTTKAAISILMILSATPIFFFILLFSNLGYYHLIFQKAPITDLTISIASSEAPLTASSVAAGNPAPIASMLSRATYVFPSSFS